jgi:spermidine/putrescine transport system ATP-binding protein
VWDASFSGASIQYQVDIPSIGLVQVFSQNSSAGQHFRQGDSVYLSWAVDHTFGLFEAPPPAQKFDPDSSTGSLALAEKEKLHIELESS